MSKKNDKNDIGFQRVAKILDEGMVQGQMHRTLRYAGRLAGGFLAGGAITAGTVEDLSRMAVGRSIDKKLGARTFAGAVEDGRKEPLDIDSVISYEDVDIGFNDALPRPATARVSNEAKLSAPTEDDASLKFAHIIDKTWVQSAEIPKAPEAKGWQAADFKRYLSVMFEPDEFVGININAWKRESEDGSVKWIPEQGVWDRSAAELTKKVDQKKGDLAAVLGDHEKAAGAWVRINPMDGKGCSDSNVSSLRHTLVEADSDDLGKQLQIIRDLQFPCSCIVHSGGKSIHALVRVCAKDMDEYKARVDYLHGVAKANGLKVDPSCKNPSRLSRLPGFERGEKKQYIIQERCGQTDWETWVEWLEDQKDDLPDIENLSKDFDNLPPKADELIQGILRRGHKMILSGPSKAGKSFDLSELAVMMASGGRWHGWQCYSGKTLYINLEVDAISNGHRFHDIFTAHGIDTRHSSMIDVWNLRGNARSLDKLAPKIIRRAHKSGYECVIIDPIYKVLTGDENNAAEMSKFTNLFDTISLKLKCAVIFCHHHSKGSQGQKMSMDRGSGSGVFARDPDAILDMIELIITPECRKQLVRIVVSKALVDAAKHEGISALEVMEDDTDAMGDPEALFMALTLKYNGKNGNADLFNLFAETKLTATEEAETMSGWRIESTLREFRKPKNTVCWFRWPVHVDDFTGMLKDALAYGELPVKLVKTEAQKQKEAEEKEERQRKKKEENAAKKAEQRLAMANDKNSHVNVMKAKEQEAAEALLVASIIRCGGEGVATLADVGRMLERSPRSVRRIVEEAGYAVENCVITTSRKEYAL